jgi:hypothetical protein
MSIETWEEKYEREDREREAAARKAWEAYKKRKPSSKERWGKIREFTFDEGTKVTSKAVLTKMTRFRFTEDGKLYMSKLTNAHQLFLVVNGPLEGKRIADDNPDYLLFNRNGRHGKEVPTCVLVHRSAFK